MARDRDSRDAWEDDDLGEEEQPQSTGLAGMLDRLRNASWVQEHPTLLKGLVVGALILLMALLLGWQMRWFAGEEQAAPAVVEQPPQPGQPQPAGQPATSADKTPSASKSKESPKSAEKNLQKRTEGEKVKPEENPPLPDDVAKWKKQDYFRARQENIPKLIEAVAALSEKTRGSAAAAQGFTGLLKPVPPPPPPPPPTPVATPPAPNATPLAARPAPGSPPAATPVPARPAPVVPPPPKPPNPADLKKLVETIIAALGDNGSEVARKTLEQILSGVTATDDDKAAVEAALKTLVAHPGPENDALLVRVIAAPEVLRPADRQGAWPAKELRSKALDLMKTGASIELRTKLAEAMADRLSRRGADDPVHEFLLAADPLNCGAQIVFFERGIFPKEINIKLEQQLASYSALALARLLKVPGTIQPGFGGNRVVNSPGNASSPTSPDLAFRLAGQLWSEKFGDSVIAKLTEGRSLEKKADAVVLACTIPRDATRAALAKTLRKHWNEGPKALDAVDAANKTLTDPGLLVLLKMFPRRSDAAKPAARPSSPRARPVRSPPAGGAAAAAKIAADKKEQAEKDWMALSSKLVTAWCARLQAAAQARDKTEAEAGSPSGSVAPKLPTEFEMANGAKVMTTYHLVWPAEIPAEMADSKPGPLEIYYLRVEETSKPKKAIGYYARQMRTSDTRKIDSSRADWLDGMRMLSQTDRRRSIDVVVTRADNKASDATKDNEEADLIVEILTIEIKNPAVRE